MRISIDGIDQMAPMRDLIRTAPAAAERAAALAVNRVARSVSVEVAKSISDRYNLTAAYVRDQITHSEGKGERPVAVVSARRRPVRLARFGVAQLTREARRAKGDRSRGIPVGRAQAGVSYTVRRDRGRSKLEDAFLLPLRVGAAGGGNGFGIFERYGRGKRDIQHLYGPSPYQSFAWWIRTHGDDIRERLARAWASETQMMIRKGRVR